MLSLVIASLPIFVTTICLLKTKSGIKAMLAGIVSGAAINISISGLSPAEGIVPIARLMLKTTTDSINVFVVTLLLGLFVSLIVHTEIKDSLERLAAVRFDNESKLTAAIIGLGFIFSLDDYLVSIAGSAVIIPSARKSGMPLERTAFLINMISASVCCISPISTWAPVISNNLKGTSVLSVYLIPFNFVAVLGILAIIHHGFTSRSSKVEHKKYSNYSSVGQVNTTLQKKDKINFIALAVSLAAMFASYIILQFNGFGEIALLGCSVLGLTCISFIVIFVTKSVSLTSLISILVKSIKSTGSLLLFLILAWSMVGICNDLLGFSSHISAIVLNASIPVVFIPIFIFVISGVFSFFTGSAYSGFALFIPIALSISEPYGMSNITLISVSAAVSGSLFAAYSVLSDNLRIIFSNIKSSVPNTSVSAIFIKQLPYGLIIASISGLGFLLSSCLSPYGIVASAVVSLTVCIACLVIALNILAGQSSKKESKQINLELVQYATSHKIIRTVVYMRDRIDGLLNSFNFIDFFSANILGVPP